MSRLEQAPVPHARQSLTYRGLLALPGALRAFGTAAVARLSFGMAGLSLLLLIHHATGSFAAAGAASGAYSAGTLTAPVKSRLMDRRGQRAVLCLLAAMAGGIALSAITPGLLLAGIVLALTGTVLAPSAVLSYLSAERLAGPGAEASAWINTAWNAGVAAGFALTGLAVGRTGTTVPMLAGAAVLLAAALAVLVRRATFDEAR
jgi:MFS family permease